MSATYKLTSGHHIQTAERLGLGGEGAVFAVQGQPNLAAKVYHTPLADERRRKLETMISLASPELREITAWPQALLLNQNGPVGFLMPRAHAAEEAHMLYSIKSRKQKFPQASYRFLTHAAFNVAKAFTVIHQHGIVVGDINEKLAMVGADATIRIIDCDSFQLSGGGRTYYCEVGVPTFTPPELQSASSLRGVTRSQQHDLFGLAVLVFHLLFLGRHPFAGRYQASGDMPIETAIKECRFAYSAQSHRTLMQPAPHTPQLLSAGKRIADYFELAFSREAAQGAAIRPTAAQWVQALKEYAAQLTPCKSNAAHAYLPDAKACPFCSIELNSRLEIFNYVEPEGTPLPTIDVEALWRTLDNVPRLSLSPSPDIVALQNTLHPSPDAQHVIAVRTLEQHVRQAERNAAQAKRALDTHHAALEQAEVNFRSAREHVLAFEADGNRMLQLNREARVWAGKLIRKRYLKIFYGVSGVLAGLTALAAFQNVLAPIAALTIFGFLYRTAQDQHAALYKQKQSADKELSMLRASIDLGLEHRQSLETIARGAVENAKRTWLAAQHVSEDAHNQHAKLLAELNTHQARAALIEKSFKSRFDSSMEAFRNRAANGHGLQDRLAELAHISLSAREKAKIAYEAIARLEAGRLAARRKAHDQAKDEQLSDYLDRFFVARQSWPKIPSSLISSLTSYSIETAADVNENDVSSVPGFGPVRTKMLLDWRRDKERGFQFDPHKSGHTAQLAAVERRISTDRRQHERELARIGEQAARANGQALTLKQQFERELSELATQLAQAILDGRSAGLRWAQIQVPTTYYPTSRAAHQPPTPPRQPHPSPPPQYSWTQSSQATARASKKKHKPKRVRRTRRRRWP